MTRTPIPHPSDRAQHGNPSTDEMVTRSIGRLMAAMPSVHVADVQFEVHRGVVTVSGTVPWPFERDTLLNLIAAVPGVLAVVDVVTLQRTDREEDHSG